MSLVWSAVECANVRREAGVMEEDQDRDQDQGETIDDIEGQIMIL